MNTEPIRALSLWQPWASLIALGQKRVETRSWTTAHRGWLAIHAGKYWNRQLLALCRTEPYESALGAQGRNLEDILPLGAIVAVARLVDVQPTAYFRPEGELELAFGDYTPGRYAWLLEDVTPIKPVPCRGAQMLWEIPVPALQLVRKRYQVALAKA